LFVFLFGTPSATYSGVEKVSYLLALRWSLLLAALAAPGFPSSVLLAETFRGHTADDWTLLGSATLTAATGLEPTGEGFLRLTANRGNQAGFAYNQTPVPFGYGLDIRFQYAIWGGTGADGIALILFDGSNGVARPGGIGGSLGYAAHNRLPGIAGGFLAIGLDEFGNFSNPIEGRNGGPGFRPNAVVVRGPGDGTTNPLNEHGASNYAYLSGVNVPQGWLQLGNGANRPAAYREARIQVDTSRISQGRLPVTVSLIVGLGGREQVVISEFDAYKSVLAFYGNDPSRIPASLKFGFGGSTGGSNNVHEIRGLQVHSTVPAPGYELAIPELSTGQMGLLGLALAGAGLVRRQEVSS
jgi:hypothetical protein